MSRLKKTLVSIALATSVLFPISSRIEDSPRDSLTQITQSEPQISPESKPVDEPSTKIEKYNPESPLPKPEKIKKSHKFDKDYKLWALDYGVDPIKFEFQAEPSKPEGALQSNPIDEITKLSFKDYEFEQLLTELKFKFDYENPQFNELDRLGTNDYETWRLFEDLTIKRRALAGLRASVENWELVRDLKRDIPDFRGYKLYESEKTKTNETQEDETGERWFEADTSAGIKAYLSKGKIPVAGFYTDFKDPSFLGYKPIKKARIGLNTLGELELTLQKELYFDWAAEFATQASPSGLGGRVSFSREIRNQSRAGISVSGTQKGASLGVDYILSY